jgi:endonuclease/exonuclease/phosphatase family metal-dependent hydrolase
VATWNVLFDAWHERPYKPNVVCSPERFRAQLDLLGAMDLDVIALNEVTSTYLRLLRGEGWVRAGYSVTPGFEEDAPGAFGNVVVCRLPLRESFQIKLARLRRPVVCALVSAEAERTVAVCAAHLTAVDRNAPRRVAQLAQLGRALERRLVDVDGALVLGDLNFHSEDENDAAPAGYDDVWLALRGDDPGYTFDAETNPMLQELWPLGFESRRMRLDRVLLRTEGYLVPRSIEVFGDQPVRPGASSEFKLRARSPWELAKRALSQLGDVALGRNLVRDPARYLRCSDHYGLVLELDRAGS